MKKRTWTMAALALVALFGVNGGTAKAEWQSIKEVQENTPERWTESYETKWRTIQIDAQIAVPDVEKLPVIRVTGASPVNGLKLLLYSEVVYNEVGQLYVISKDGEPEILGNNEDYKNRYYFADGEIPQIQAEDHPLTAQQAIEMLENKLKGLTGYGKDDFRLYVATGTEDEAFGISTSQMISLLEYDDLFKPGDNTSCSMMIGGTHSIQAVYTYLYHILPSLFAE